MCVLLIPPTHPLAHLMDLHAHLHDHLQIGLLIHPPLPDTYNVFSYSPIQTPALTTQNYSSHLQILFAYPPTSTNLTMYFHTHLSRHLHLQTHLYNPPLSRHLQIVCTYPATYKFFLFTHPPIQPPTNFSSYLPHKLKYQRVGSILYGGDAYGQKHSLHTFKGSTKLFSRTSF